jgi:PAS domain S-box-containing protein
MPKRSDTVILLVEDNADHAELVHHAFKRSRDGYRLVIAGSGSAAAACLETCLPSMILSDYLLPDGTGLDLFRQLFREKCPSTPFVLLTSHGDETVAVEAMKLGATDYIVKTASSMASLPDVCRATLREYAQKKEKEKASDEFERFFSVLPDLACIASTDGYFRKLNPAWEETLGFSVEELLATPFLELVHPDDLERTKTEVEKQLKGSEAISFCNRYRCKNGQYRELEWKSAPANASSSLLYATARDITERKRIENEYRVIIQTTKDGFWIIDLAGRFLEVNDAYCAMVGYSREELLGMRVSDMYVEDGFSQVAARIDKVVREGYDRFDRTQRCKNGSLLDVEICTSYLRDRECLCVFVRDITERKHLEAQLRQAQKMEAVGQLAGGVAHDFNNILQVVMGYSYLLSMDKKLDEAQKEAVEQIISSSEKAAQLTTGLLALSRKQVMAPRQANLNAVVQHVQKFLVRIIGEDIQFKLRLNKTMLPVVIDVGQIEQVLMNLATNARDAMPKGGLLAIETGLQVIETPFQHAHGVSEPGRYAWMAVSDTGCGMDEATRTRMFEPFFTTKEVGKGTGLGMAIVYGIVRQHNGFVSFYSEPGHGTTFRVYIPIADAESAWLEANTKQEPPPMGSETILLAEDDANVRELVVTVLTKFGYRVVQAEDGEQAVEKFLAHSDSIGLILMDMIMPKKNGKDAYEEICRLQPGVKVLYSSGYTADFIQNRGVSDEEVELIMKPVQPLQLLRKVREMLDS